MFESIKKSIKWHPDKLFGKPDEFGDGKYLIYPGQDKELNASFSDSSHIRSS